MSHLTPIGIVNYPHLAERDTRGESPSNKYKVELYFTPEQLSTGVGKELSDAIKQIAAEAKKSGKTCKHNPLYEVDKEEQGNIPDELYGKGYLRIRASTNFDDIRDNGLIVDQHRESMSKEEILKKIVSGSKGRAYVKPCYYSQQGGGVSLALLTYQYCGKGDFEIRGGVSAKAVFEDIEIPDEPMEEGAPKSVFG